MPGEIGGTASFSILDSVSNEEVLYVTSDGTSNLSFSGTILTITDASSGYPHTVARTNSNFVESVSTSSDGNTTTVTMKYNIKALSASSSSGNNVVITLQTSATNRKSVDITTLPGWASLSAKTYDITVVAKANGYRDSDPSVAVSVEKASTNLLTTSNDEILQDSNGNNLEFKEI